MPTDLTPADLANLRRLLAAATNGPWQDDTVCGIHAPGVMIAECYHSEHDAALIAALVNAAPALIAMAERAVGDPVPFVCERCFATYYEHRGGEYLCPTCAKEDIAG